MQSASHLVQAPLFDNKTAPKSLVEYVSEYVSRISTRRLYHLEQIPDDMPFFQCLCSSLETFLNILVSKTHLSKSELIQALAYVEKLILTSEKLVLRPANVHLLVLVCIIVANKSTCLSSLPFSPVFRLST